MRAGFVNASGSVTSGRPAAPAEAAGPADLPLSVHDLRGRSRLEYLLREVHANLEQDRPDVAVTNLCHAVRVATGADHLSDSEDVLLRLVDRDFGGIL